MKRVDLVIPTRNRLEKLKRTLMSIPLVPWLYVHIVCDGDRVTYGALDTDNSSLNLTKTLIGNHVGSVGARNAVIPKCPDGVLYGVDDIDFLPGCIEAALEAFNAHFSDDDGVVGICQVDHKNWHPTGVALVGKRFLDRYPGRRLFNPGYWHFAAQEVGWLADKLGRFYQCPEAKIRHYHPDFGRSGKVDPHLATWDQTHKEARVRGVADRALRAERQRKGLIWGDGDV